MEPALTMDRIRFEQSCEMATWAGRIRSGVGTMGEKTLHAVLKLYFDSDEAHHEVKTGSFFADISNDHGIIEIQTRQFDKLRKKLESFLAAGPVTVVYPIACTKWLMWMDETTGEVTPRRKSPKKGMPGEVFPELYKIKPFLTHPNFRLCVILMDMDEYRRLNGWSKDKKKGSSRYERIPTDLIDEIHVEDCSQYSKLMPAGLSAQFSVKDYKAAARITQRSAQAALNVLRHVGAVHQTGKVGNRLLYESAEFSHTLDF